MPIVTWLQYTRYVWDYLTLQSIALVQVHMCGVIESQYIKVNGCVFE